MKLSVSWSMNRTMAIRINSLQVWYHEFWRFLKGCFFLELTLWMTHAEIYRIGFGAIPRALLIYFFLVGFNTRTWPKKNQEVSYKADFFDDEFVITGGGYKRTCFYNCVRKVIINRKYLILITDHEGVIIPIEMFESKSDIQKLRRRMKNGRKKNSVIS